LVSTKLLSGFQNAQREVSNFLKNSQHTLSLSRKRQLKPICNIITAPEVKFRTKFTI